MLTLGNNTLIVSNPGAGLSSPATLSVYLPLPTNDLVYDSHRGLLWASVPSSAGATLGNSIGVTSRVITSADPSHFVTTGSVQLDNLTGDAFDLTRWGGDGLAFRTAKDFWGNGSGRVILLRGSFVLPPSSTPNLVPKASTLSPNSAVAPGSNTWVTITGSNFVPGSVALWNGAQRTTVFVNAGKLRVAIPASDLAKPTTAKVSVGNPAPGGGKSAALLFTVQ